MEHQLSIVFVTNNYIPYCGGVVSSIHAFYDELEKQGHKVTIITLDFLGKNHCDERNVVRIVCPIKFRFNQNHIAIPFFLNAQIKREIAKLNPDIVHVHHPFLLGPVACNVAQKMGKPVVFTYHTLYEKYLHYIPFPTVIVEPIVRKLVKNFCTNVQTIIVPSTAVQQLLIKQGIITPTVVLPSPLEPIFFSGIQYKQIRKRKRFKLLTVSRFTKEKNITFLLEMFAQLDASQFELTLLGYGSEFNALHSHAYTKLGLSDNDVKFIVKPSKEKLLQYYQNADLFVYASQTETQGLVMLEAMASGLPVISLPGPGQQDFIENDKNGYLVADCKSMIEHIEYLFKNQILLEHLKEGAYKTTQHYIPFQVTIRLIELYKTLI